MCVKPVLFCLSAAFIRTSPPAAIAGDHVEQCTSSSSGNRGQTPRHTLRAGGGRPGNSADRGATCRTRCGARNSAATPQALEGATEEPGL